MMLPTRLDNPQETPAAMLRQAMSAARGALRFAVRLGALAAALTLAVQPAAAQQKRPKLIRDVEIETLLRDYMRPIWAAAGLTQQNIRVVLIDDPSFNAFVMDGKRIFVNTGALMQSDTPNEIIGVLAHETGHIAGGHLARMRLQLEGAQTAAIVAMLLAVGGVAASAGSDNVGGNPAGLITGPQEAIRRTLLAYQRGEEQAADRAAVSYLSATKQSPRGMVKTFERFQNDQLFISQRVDPYVLSHPMARERIAALEELAARSPYVNAKDPPALQARHDMMRAKLYGFTQRPDAVARRYPLSNTSLPARYARAISTYRFGNVPDGVRQIDGLIAEQPNNPYFYELKGQALLESGRAREAVAPLRKATELTGGNPLLRTMLGQSLVESGDKASTDEAIRELNFGLQRDSNSSTGWRYLATAYGQKGDLANADLASAQSAFYGGDYKLARELAGRARLKFPLGSPGWLKADDIVNFKPPSMPVRRQ
jgi:predicted Zn-dependent protease